MQYDIKKLTQPAKVLTIQSIKSYGEKWEGSKARVVVDVVLPGGTETQRVLDETIEGSHTSSTSVNYSTEYSLGDIAVVGSHARIQITLVGGTTFKLTGMMLCSR
jgi:hypothetical protein